MEQTHHLQKAVALRPVRWRDFQWLALGAAVLLALLAGGERAALLHPLRIALGVAAVLFMPGYCLTAALFPGPTLLKGVERAGLSFGLSLALLTVLVLGLQLVPGGLTLWPITGALYGSSALCALLAIWRRRHAAITELADPAGQPSLVGQKGFGVRPGIYGAALAVVAGILVVAGSSVAFPSEAAYTTEFSIVNAPADGYPRTVRVGEPLTATLAVVNRERADRSYRVELREAAAGQDAPLLASSSLDVQRGDEQRVPVSWQMRRPGSSQAVDILLFRANEQAPYRTLRLQLNVVAADTES